MLPQPRTLVLFFTGATLAVGCNIIAPFDVDDLPDSSSPADGDSDTDSDGDMDSDGNADGDSGYEDRITDGLIVFYDFEEGAGDVVRDGITGPDALDLTIYHGDDVSWTSPPGGLQLGSVDHPPTVSSPGVAHNLISACVESDAITIEAWVRADSLSFDGTPARIATLSGGTGARFINVSLLQGSYMDGSDRGVYSVRIRTAELVFSGIQAGGVSTSELVHVLFTWDGEAMALYINGVQEAGMPLGGNLDRWGQHGLSLGSELGTTDRRPWSGDIHLLAFYDRALAPSEVMDNFNAGPDPAP